MNLIEKVPFLVLEPEKIKANELKKRQIDEKNSEVEKKKLKLEGSENINGGKLATEFKVKSSTPNSIVHRSPKKRLEVNVPQAGTKHHTQQPRFIYGNYQHYYGYRNKNVPEKDFQDVRLTILHNHLDMFKEKEILDIGCNNGFITMQVAKRFPIKHITGLDIDRSLIRQAQKQLIKLKRSLNPKNDASTRTADTTAYPFNIKFVHGNYVLRDDVLLDIECQQFDMILCLSITKWIHLNFGDAGLKQAFRRMFLQLRSGGRLILEPQPFDNYGRRKKMTATIHENFKAMKFFPKQFDDFLLSSDVGFQRMELLGIPDHMVAGFKRPIKIFYKS